MDILTADGECFYGDKYTLSQMTTEEYLRDPRFEPIMWGLKWNDTPAFWIHPGRAEQYFKYEVDWANTAVLAHHAHFDLAWLNWKYGVRPAMILDTLSMARCIDGPKAGNSLHDLCIRHAIGEKGDFVTFAKNKRYADFTAAELDEYGRYCVNDVEKEYLLAQKFLPLMPADELALIDTTVRMFSEPTLIGDAEMLRGAVVSERARKKTLLTQLGFACPMCGGEGYVPDLLAAQQSCKKCAGLGIDKKPFGSSDKFAELLRLNGVEPETKTSPSTGEQIFAFARTDPAMQSLLEDEDEVIRLLAEARLAVKSNIVETRAERFQHMAERGPLPVYLKYCGAHTWRWSGGDGTNWQNFSNAIEGAARPEMAVLKQAIGAPEGHHAVSVDGSQGEARVLAWLAQQLDLIEIFAAGKARDLYSETATEIYGRLIERRKNKSDYIPGQVGKIVELSFGFGSGYYTASMGFLKGVLGAPPIQFTQADMDTMGVDPNRFLNSPRKLQQVNHMPSRLNFNDLAIHCIVVDSLVQRYRAKRDKICGKGGFWAQMETAIDDMIAGRERLIGPAGVIRTAKERLWLPNGTWLDYHGIQRDRESGDATYWNGRNRTKIYGSLLTENVVQKIHRDIVAGQKLEIKKGITGIGKVALSTHDEVTVVVPIEAAPTVLEFMRQVMAKAPSWASGLPLASEGGHGKTLADAK